MTAYHLGVYHKLCCSECEHEWFEEDEWIEDTITCPGCAEELEIERG